MVDRFRSYLDTQTLASIEGLGLQARSIVEGYIAGLHRSPYHGFSVEFAQHREYAPGDDIRHIDWKVWAKTDKLYLKQYEEETNLLTYLLLDTSESMSYASPDQGEVTKLKYCQWIAASLAYLVLQQHDSVGLATFDETVRRYVRPAGQAAQLKELIHVMDVTPSRYKTDLKATFQDLSDRFSKRGIIVVLSDLFGEVDQVIDGLKQFRHRRHEVIVFHVLDPAELDFPFQQPTLFQGLEEMPELLTDPQSLRRAYQEEINAYLERVRRGCQMTDIDYVPLRTDQSLDTALSTYLAARAGRLALR